jgi:hypothetical protein
MFYFYYYYDLIKLGKEVVMYNMNEIPGFVTEEKCGEKFLVGFDFFLLDIKDICSNLPLL